MCCRQGGIDGWDRLDRGRELVLRVLDWWSESRRQWPSARVVWKCSIWSLFRMCIVGVIVEESACLTDSID